MYTAVSVYTVNSVVQYIVHLLNQRVHHHRNVGECSIALDNYTWFTLLLCVLE